MQNEEKDECEILLQNNIGLCGDVHGDTFIYISRPFASDKKKTCSNPSAFETILNYR